MLIVMTFTLTVCHSVGLSVNMMSKNVTNGRSLAADNLIIFYISEDVAYGLLFLKMKNGAVA